jgi:hypothetical protein
MINIPTLPLSPCLGQRKNNERYRLHHPPSIQQGPSLHCVSVHAASRHEVWNHVADCEVLTPSLLISVRVVLTFFVSLWSKSVERTRRVIQRSTLIGEAGLSIDGAPLTDFLTGRRTHIAAWQYCGNTRDTTVA